MPECLVRAYWQHLPRLKAERQLELAQVVSVPHLTKQGAESWYERVLAQRWPAEAATPGPQRSALSFNGQAMSTAAIRQKLGQVLGGGFSA